MTSSTATDLTAPKFVIEFIKQHYVAVGASFLVPVSLFFLYTKKDRMSALASKQPNRIVDADKALIVAHKGAALEAPENTLGSIRKVAENGGEAVEIDVVLSGDNVAVLMHDWTLDRTTDASGKVSSLTVDQLKNVNAAHHFQG